MLNTKWQFEEKESEVQKTRGYRGYAAGLEGCKGEIKYNLGLLKDAPASKNKNQKHNSLNSARCLY